MTNKKINEEIKKSKLTSIYITISYSTILYKKLEEKI